MKEIITEVIEPNYVTVKKGTKVRKIKQYQTKDGKIFNDKAEAENHEFRLVFDEIEHVTDSFIYDLGERWYKAKDEKELELLKQRLTWSHADIHGLDNVRVGEWFNYRVADGGDYRDDIYFTPLSEFENEVSRLMGSLKGERRAS